MVISYYVLLGNEIIGEMNRSVCCYTIEFVLPAEWTFQKNKQQFSISCGKSYIRKRSRQSRQSESLEGLKFKKGIYFFKLIPLDDYLKMLIR